MRHALSLAALLALGGCGGAIAVGDGGAREAGAKDASRHLDGGHADAGADAKVKDEDAGSHADAVSDADYNALVANGVVFVRPPPEESYGTVAVFQDLYGNMFDLVGRK
jgi:hypothetical protein